MPEGHESPIWYVRNSGNWGPIVVVTRYFASPPHAKPNQCEAHTLKSRTPPFPRYKFNPHPP